MCFYLESNCPPNIAQEDIICYKIMIKLKDNTLHSIISNLDINYSFDKIYTAVKVTSSETISFISKLNAIALSHPYHTFIVEEGFHSYTTLPKANLLLTESSLLDIIECVIPKGTPYYENKLDKEYVSTKIKFVKEIK